jgi:hypothetical protein
MRRVIALTAVVLTAACSQGAGTPVAHVSPSPSQMASPVPTASPMPTVSAVPVPSPFPDLPLTKVDFSCQLPVYVQTGYEGSTDFSRRGELISFPSGSKEVKVGPGGGYFDRAFNIWLPVTRESVSPDGTSYAQVDMVSQVLRVVDVASGRDRTFPLGSIGAHGANVVIDFAADGIYMAFGFEGLHGLSVIDPVTGSSHDVQGVGAPEASGGGGVFWDGEVNPADPHPIVTGASVGIMGTLPNQVTSVNVKTGNRTPWFYRPGNGVGVVGLDIHGHPLISVVQRWGTDISELLLSPSPGSYQSIYKGPVTGTLGGAIPDSHGVWFGSAQGIYLYSETGGLIKVTNEPGYPANGCS